MLLEKTNKSTPIYLDALEIVPTPESPTVQQSQPTISTVPTKPIENTPETITVSDFIQYQIVGDRVKWLELAFHKCSTAKEWQSQIELWGGNAGKPHKISRNGIKWLLCVSNLPIPRLEQILASNLEGSPQQPSRK